MNRFFISPDRWDLDALSLDEGETHHLRDVLRMKPGERVAVFNGQGAEVTAEIADVAKDVTKLKRLHHGKTPPLPCRITLAQAIPKGKTMDLIVQKATELGAAAIVPLISERTVTQLDADEAGKKREKWRQVAIEAAKQCGQNWLPDIPVPVAPRAFFEQGRRFDLMLIASLQSDAVHLKQVLAEHEEERGRLPASALVLVGPEGDFTPAESALAKSFGCRPITLGPIVLRTETASIYCMSVLSYELMNRQERQRRSIP